MIPKISEFFGIFRKHWSFVKTADDFFVPDITEKLLQKWNVLMDNEQIADFLFAYVVFFIVNLLFIFMSTQICML